MTGGVFVGPPRPLWKVLLYSLITFGVYGRVHLYKSANDIDGHEALFLDLRLWLLGVILPVGGPLVVKWRLLHHLEPMVRHDATAPRLHARWLRLAAFVPLLPVYHVLLQRHLSHHWTLHRKIADLKAREEVLETRRASARTEEDREEIRRLEADLRMRADVLKQAREAALEIREAQRARARAEQEIRAAGGGPSTLERIKRLAPVSKLKFPRRGDHEPVPEGVPPEPETEPARPEPPRVREPEPDLPAPSVPPVPTSGAPNPDDPGLSKAERKALKRHLDAKAKREEAAQRKHEKAVSKARKAAEKASQPEPAPEALPPSEPSKKEEKWWARYERARDKRERKAAKAREKEERKQAREEAKATDAPPAAETPPEKRRFGFLRRGPAEGPEPVAAPEPPPAPEPEPVPVPAEEAPKATRAKPRAAKARARPKSKK